MRLLTRGRIYVNANGDEMFWLKQRKLQPVKKEPKFSICVCVLDDGEVNDEQQQIDAWLGKWRDKLIYFKNTGCGCCVNIYEVDGPQKAIDELPYELVSPYRKSRVRDRTIYNLFIRDVGPNRAQVFVILRRVIGLSPSATKDLLDTKSP